MWMLLEQNSSWRQGSQPQAINLPQDLGEQDSRDRDLRELEGDIAAMGQDLPVELDQLLSEHFQRSVFWFLWYGGLPLLMQWTAPTRRHLGAKMVVDFAEPFESACGYKQTSSCPESTSALPPKADILMAIIDFRL